MKRAIKKQWVEALRSGKYKQGEGALCQDAKFCCLGVLVDLYIKEKGLKWKKTKESSGMVRRSLDGEELLLPDEIQAWAGLKNSYGSLKKPIEDCAALIELNDRAHFKFGQIADVIQKQF